MSASSHDHPVRKLLVVRLAAGLAVAVLVLGSSGSLHAQQAALPGPPPLRSGFHFSLGVGFGSVAASCDECEVEFFEDRLTGLSGFVQVGRAVNSKLIIAAEGSGWVKNESPTLRRIAALGLMVLVYPSETGGFFVKGGVGWLRATVEDDFSLYQTDAWTGRIGVGYDIVMGDAMISPYATYEPAFDGETTFNNIVSPAAALPTAIQFGVALTVH